MLSEAEVRLLFVDITQNDAMEGWTNEYYKIEVCPLTGQRKMKGLSLTVDVSLIDESWARFMDDSPLFPEKVTLTDDQLSYWQKRHKRETNMGVNTPKLMLTLHPKRGQTVDWRYLKLSTKVGWKIDRIVEACEFTVSFYARTWIQENAKRRQEAKTEVGGHFCKTTSNTLFGKCLLRRCPPWSNPRLL